MQPKVSSHVTFVRNVGFGRSRKPTFVVNKAAWVSPSVRYFEINGEQGQASE
jgi:hypothetical protein